MTTDVPSGLSSSSIDAKPSARARASIVLRLGSDVPERMSATVPRPRPDARANGRASAPPRAPGLRSARNSGQLVQGRALYPPYQQACRLTLVVFNCPEFRAQCHTRVVH
jgi:hypothetical protein